MPRTSAIAKASPVPYYAQLADILRTAITDGELAPDAPLPSEAELGTTYGLSRTAVRQALGELAAEGLVRKEKGRGTFVRGPKRADLIVQEMRGFHDELSERGHSVATRVLDQGVDASTVDEATLLQVPTGSAVVRLERLRFADGAPICVARTVVSATRFAGLEEHDLEGVSLYKVLSSEYGVEVTGGHRMIEAAAADRAYARHLGVKTGAPLLKLSSINNAQDGQPFELFTAWYRADRTTFQVSVRMP
ncbi:MAG: putative GntR family transcriptional regulator [Frankiales bacterium]|jgi:GntR family transcriptional regulator|nr:putative GntR family transcriptional regulator [Frankiales bacterium]